MTLSLARVLHSRSRSPIIYFSLEQDPRIDGNLLKLGPEDHLLMLTTGGCNVLDRLLDGVGHIVSVDLNPSQNALLELRLAAARRVNICPRNLQLVHRRHCRRTTLAETRALERQTLRQRAIRARCDR